MYSTPHEDVKVEAVMQDETLWLSQRGMAQLFGVSVPTINYHLSSVYEQDELEQGATVRKFLIVQQEGSRQVSRNVDCYNLDAIISFQQYEILDGCGKISRERAAEKAGQEYEAFNRTQRIVSDFDREIKQLEGRSKG